MPYRFVGIGEALGNKAERQMRDSVNMLSAFRKGLLLAAISLAVAGCGIRGSLDAPAEAKAAGTATSPESQDPGKNSAAPEKEHRPFILDGLLR